VDKESRHLGLADERCPKHDIPIETYLDSHGRNPVRRCFKCWIEEVELESQCQDAMANWHYEQALIRDMLERYGYDADDPSLYP
jgi:hypothetical protein